MNIDCIDAERYETWAPYSNHQTYCEPSFHAALFSTSTDEPSFARPAAIHQDHTYLDQRVKKSF